MRSNKWIAQAMGISRRAADELIAYGVVTVNDKTCEPGQHVSPPDVVRVHGKIIRHSSAEKVTVLLHKPIGFVCSKRGQGAPTVYSLLPETYRHLDIAGRLDKDSSGLVVLTSDGDLLHRLTHPSHEKIKRYEINLHKSLTAGHQATIAQQGVQLEDGISRLQLKPLNEQRTSFEVLMHEGRNRQIRRTFDALGYTVTDLKRTHLGPYSLDELTPKKWRLVAPVEK